jgi:hypothetical protein
MVTNSTRTALGITAGGTALAGFGGLLGYHAARKRYSKRRKPKRRNYSSSIRKRSYTKKKRYPYTAGKRKDRSTRRIRFTKKGQPYVIMASGKARFIKKTSARNSRKRSGGRY